MNDSDPNPPAFRLRVYLDTSVVSALHDARTPERLAQTIAFWARLPALDACTSALTLDEIADTPDASRRRDMERSAAEVRQFEVDTAMRGLAERYIRAQIFATTQRADALHVAAATLGRADVLVSWNFRHLVNRRRRALVNALNVSIGASSIDIISPPELQ
ncbi:MAG: PIN domain-containing protein [Phycisphaerales bacterium]|nr:PIN domain-containing protein [Phycisphaerales bacterium]